MSDNSSLGLATAKAKTAEQAQRAELVGRLIKPTAPASQVTAPHTGGDTVTIGCKMPMGLTLRLHEMVDDAEPMFGGGYKKVKRFQTIPGTVTVRGPASLWGNPNLAGEQLEVLLPTGYALTHGVSREFWEK